MGDWATVELVAGSRAKLIFDAARGPSLKFAV